MAFPYLDILHSAISDDPLERTYERIFIYTLRAILTASTTYFLLSSMKKCFGGIIEFSGDFSIRRKGSSINDVTVLREDGVKDFGTTEQRPK